MAKLDAKLQKEKTNLKNEKARNETLKAEAKSYLDTIEKRDQEVILI